MLVLMNKHTHSIMKTVVFIVWLFPALIMAGKNTNQNQKTSGKVTDGRRPDEGVIFTDDVPPRQMPGGGTLKQRVKRGFELPSLQTVSGLKGGDDFEVPDFGTQTVQIKNPFLSSSFGSSFQPAQPAQPVSTCKTDEYQCIFTDTTRDPECIDASYQCDGYLDCESQDFDESSDEHDCDCDLLEKFKCSNGLCISYDWLCDGWEDCTRGDDEHPCDGCSGAEFTCPLSGYCVPLSSRCDGKQDCGEWADEEGCGTWGEWGEWTECSVACGGGMRTRMKQCVDNAGNTGNDITCKGAMPTAEENCNTEACLCTAEQFTCSDGACIAANQKCDDVKDCSSGEDEINCHHCSTGEVSCDNGQCIDDDRVCDGVPDCTDFSDEVNDMCDEEDVCSTDEIRCDGLGTKCLPLIWWCDRWNDCSPSNADEISCAVCPSPNIKCATEDGRSCLHERNGCDGTPQCRDGRDEPVFTEWSPWTTDSGSTECPEQCDAGSRFRSRACDTANRKNQANGACNQPCAKDKAQLKQERVCPKIGCFRESSSGPGARPARIQFLNRIVGGEKANEKDWPWQCQIFRDVDADGRRMAFTCGCTLIPPRDDERQTNAVLTAAHCFTNKPTDPAFWRVSLGKFNRHAWAEGEPDAKNLIPVTHLILHENYNDITSDNDIAIMILAEKVSVSSSINPVALNPIDVAMRKAFDSSSECFATGWGAVSEGGNLADELQEAHIPLVPHRFCYEIFRDDDQIGGSWITDNMLCAGLDDFGIDACQGDSGGPLVCIAEDYPGGPARWYQVGVTSWGNGCARKGFPGVYALVDNYLEWIDDQVKNAREGR